MYCYKKRSQQQCIKMSIFLYIFIKMGANTILAFATWIKKKRLLFVLIQDSFGTPAAPQCSHSVLVPTSSQASPLNRNPCTSGAIQVRQGTQIRGFCCFNERENLMLWGKTGVFKCVKIQVIWQFPELRLHQEANLVPTHKHLVCGGLGGGEGAKWCPPAPVSADHI